MAIQALPPATTRILNSSQVLTTPASLVKELVDNAFDAKASSIDVIISNNTLDKIEVRDNGYGIAACDLNALGRHGYTSKLRDFEELKTVGGLSLGFRGEALASAVELGQVTVTTRTDGEAIATSVKLKSPGLIHGQNTVSHPVGTTVTVVDFLAKFPVRKQVAKRESKKTLSTIKHMLQSYALARTSVRLNFKVLNAAKNNWSFAPRQNGSIREAVSLVIGPDTAAQCIENTSTWTSVMSGTMSSDERTVSCPIGSADRNESGGGFIFQAFIPRPNADFSKIGGGHHVSIDSRPVSCARGPLKKFIATYKSHIRAACGSEFADKIKNPFIRVNIVCPAGSYDPNSEPAKDDVIFGRPADLLASAEQWLQSLYGYSRPATDFDQVPHATNNNFENRLARNDDVEVQQSDNNHEVSTRLPFLDVLPAQRISTHTSPPQNSFFSSGMRLPRQDNKREDITQNTVESWLNLSPTGIRFEQKDSRVGAPCLLPKIMDKTTPSTRTLRAGTIVRGNFISASKLSQESLPQQLSLGDSTAVSTKFADVVSIHGRNREWDFDMSRDFEEDLDPLDPVSKAPRKINSIPVDDNSQDHTAHLNPWVIAKLNARVNVSSNRQNHAEKQTTIAYDDFKRAAETDDAKANTLATKFCNSSGQLHNTTIPPQNTQIGNHLNPSPRRTSQSTMPKDSRSIYQSFRPPRQNEPQKLTVDDDVEDALDYERRKEEATLKIRELLQAENSSNDTVCPQTNPVAVSSISKGIRDPALFATAGVSSRIIQPSASNQAHESALTTLPDGDPRAYLIRRQKSLTVCGEAGDPPKLRRAKTILLPLESITEAIRLTKLVHTVSETDIALVRKAVIELRDVDDWIKSGKQALGLDIAISELSMIELKIRNVIVKNLDVGKKGEVVVDMSKLLCRSVAVIA